MEPALGRIQEGVLEAVTDLGIVGEFADTRLEEETMRAFYPWSAVLVVTPTE